MSFGGKSSQEVWHQALFKYKHWEDSDEDGVILTPHEDRNLNSSSMKIHATLTGDISSIICTYRKRKGKTAPTEKWTNHVPIAVFRDLIRDVGVSNGYLCKSCFKIALYENPNKLSPKMQMLLLSVTDL